MVATPEVSTTAARLHASLSQNHPHKPTRMMMTILLLAAAVFTAGFVAPIVSIPLTPLLVLARSKPSLGPLAIPELASAPGNIVAVCLEPRINLRPELVKVCLSHFRLQFEEGVLNRGCQQRNTLRHRFFPICLGHTRIQFCLSASSLRKRWGDNYSPHLPGSS